MVVDKAGLYFLTEGEGIELNAYLDSVGIPTIGRGVIQYPDGRKVKMGDKITKEYELELFAVTLQKYVKKTNQVVKKPINQNQFNALVSFCYNVGMSGLESSTLLKKVNVNPNDPAIRAEFMKWNKGRIKGVLTVIKGLTNRRTKEANLYFK